MIVFSGWVVKQFATDGGLLPAANPIDYVGFTVAVAITLYLTYRLFGGCIDPCQQFLQFIETEQVRFLGPEDGAGEAVDTFLGKFRHRTELSPGLYANQVNEGPVESFDTAVGIGVRADLDEQLAYRMTKAFWDNIDSVMSDAPWAKVLDPAFAAGAEGTMALHPGAERYYREIGAL